MKLYFAPGACSLSPHIVLRELGLPFDAVKVDLRASKTQDGKDFKSITPKGAVPTLQLDDGAVLTEGAVIVQYLADQKPEAGLLPKPGTLERYRVQEWLNYIASELHKSFSPLFNPKAPDEYKALMKAGLADKFGFIASQLKGDYLTGSHFTVADAYLYVMLTWAGGKGVDAAPLAAYRARIEARPAVKAALDAEAKARA